MKKINNLGAKELNEEALLNVAGGDDFGGAQTDNERLNPRYHIGELVRVYESDLCGAHGPCNAMIDTAQFDDRAKHWVYFVTDYEDCEGLFHDPVTADDILGYV